MSIEQRGEGRLSSGASLRQPSSPASVRRGCRRAIWGLRWESACAALAYLTVDEARPNRGETRWRLAMGAASMAR